MKKSRLFKFPGFTIQFYARDFGVGIFTPGYFCRSGEQRRSRYVYLIDCKPVFVGWQVA